MILAIGSRSAQTDISEVAIGSLRRDQSGAKSADLGRNWSFAIGSNEREI